MIQEQISPWYGERGKTDNRNAKASLGEIRGIFKRSEEEKTIWQREKKEMLRQVSRFQEEVLTRVNDKTSLEEILKRSEGEEDKTVWHREREEIHQ
jgi:hypothetical protein